MDREKLNAIWNDLPKEVQDATGLALPDHSTIPTQYAVSHIFCCIMDYLKDMNVGPILRRPGDLDAWVIDIRRPPSAKGNRWVSTQPQPKKLDAALAAIKLASAKMNRPDSDGWWIARDSVVPSIKCYKVFLGQDRDCSLVYLGGAGVSIDLDDICGPHVTWEKLEPLQCTNS